MDFTEVKSEKSVGQIRPDIVAIVGTTMLFVEVAVTHFVDPDKQAVLEKLGLPTIEIDLANFLGERWTWELLTEHVIEHALNKRWLHFLDEKALHDEAQSSALHAALATPLPALEAVCFARVVRGIFRGCPFLVSRNKT